MEKKETTMNSNINLGNPMTLAGAAALAAISPEAPMDASVDVPVEAVVVVANRIPVAASDSGRSVNLSAFMPQRRPTGRTPTAGRHRRVAAL